MSFYKRVWDVSQCSFLTLNSDTCCVRSGEECGTVMCQSNSGYPLPNQCLDCQDVGEFECGHCHWSIAGQEEVPLSE
jgi:hypothetical protein